MSEPVTAEQAIDRLNEIHRLDPTVLHRLVTGRVPCNEALADHDTVQVGGAVGGPYSVGLLGILNGIFGTQPGTRVGWIAAHYNDAGELDGFQTAIPTDYGVTVEE